MRRNRSNEAVPSAAGGSPAPKPSQAHAPAQAGFALVVACMGLVVFGYQLAALNGSLEQVVFELGIGGSWKAVALLQGLVVMLHLAGMALGSLTGCGFADLLGRRQLLLVAAQLLILAPLASVQAPVFERWNGPTHQVDGRPKRVAVMLVSRFIMGIATGASSAVIPVYIMEVAPAATRHALSNLCQMGTWAGIVAAMVANTLLPAKHWRAVLFLGEVPAMALAVGMLVCPETPSWLVARGRQAEADAAARWLWGPNTAYELSYLPGATASSFPKSVEIKGWPAPSLWSACMAAAQAAPLLLCPYQPFTGMHLLAFYSTLYLRQVGVQRHNITTLALGLAYMAGALLAFYLERMLSRKALLTSSWVGQGLALMCVSSASRDGIGGGTLVAGCIIAALAFGVGAGPPSTLNKQELNPSHIKGTTAVAATLAHWVHLLTSALLFPLLLELQSPSRTLGLAAVAALLCGLHSWNAVPSTRVQRLRGKA